MYLRRAQDLPRLIRRGHLPLPSASVKSRADACAKRSSSVRLAKVLTTAQPLHAEVRKAVREAWGAEIVDVYSAQEVGHIAVQCPEYEQYHVHAEQVLVEILNERTEACAPGEVGRVVVTP